MDTAFDIVELNDKKYAVLSVKHQDGLALHVIDEADLEKVAKYPWHRSNDYIRSNSYKGDDKLSRFVYMHNFVCGRFEMVGQGATESLDHINRCGRDNRKENLRLVSQTEQNYNREKLDRKVILPADCGFNAEDIPTNIWYIQPEKWGTGSSPHDAGFAVQIKGIPTLGNGMYVWKGTRSKDVSLKDRLRHAIYHLRELMREHPELHHLRELEVKRIGLVQTFNEILRKSHFPEEIIESNVLPEITLTTMWDDEDPAIERLAKRHKAGKKVDRDPAFDKYVCPKYCRIEPAKNGKGPMFIIERHPGSEAYFRNRAKPMPKKQQIKSTSSIKVSLDEKYKQMLAIYQELESYT